jgi:ATP-dependent RNA helicase RhlE
MSDFNSLGLPEAILRALADQKHVTPTKIQEAAIPAILAGNDVVGIAQTGTGKTGAFVLPLLARLASENKRAPARGSHVLILAPTRELASQIEDSVRSYGAYVRPRTAVVVGGVAPGGQIRAMANGLDILVATPGRLLDHISTGAATLAHTQVIVLDEADQMLDLGFMPAIRRLMAMLPRERQTILLSATMPKEIRQLASNFLRNPQEIAVAPASKPIERIEQSAIALDNQAKRGVLGAILQSPDCTRAIVFTRTKRGADRVSKFLDFARIPCAAIHGNKSQNQRERALDSFRDGHIKVLVATDIAARGIDVDGVSHVINYELPNVPEAYVHRIGRTARAGKSGIAIALVAPDERAFLRDIERLTKLQVPFVAAPEGIAMPEGASLSEPAERDPRSFRGGRHGNGHGNGNGHGGQHRSGGPRHRGGPRHGEQRNGEQRHGEQRPVHVQGDAQPQAARAEQPQAQPAQGQRHEHHRRADGPNGHPHGHQGHGKGPHRGGPKRGNHRGQGKRTGGHQGGGNGGGHSGAHADFVRSLAK